MANRPRIGITAYLDTAEFTKGLKTYLSGLEAMNLATVNTSHGAMASFSALGNRVLGVVSSTVTAMGILGTATAGAIGKMGYDAIQASIQVEDAFAGVVKTAGNLTTSYGVLNQAGTELKQTLLDLSTRKPMPVEDLMRIAQVGAQAGLSSDILDEFAASIADLVVASDMPLELAATKVAQMMTIMELGAGDVSRLGSALADLGNKFPGTEEEALVMAQRIAGMGSVVGLTTQQVLAIAMALTAVGVRAEAGGTAVQKVLITMQEAMSGTAEGYIDNSDKIAKSTQRIADLQAQLAVQEQRVAEQTDKTRESTRMAQQLAVERTRQALEEEIANLEMYQASHGKTAAQLQGDLALFAKTAGMSAQEFRQTWQQDPGKAFELFARGLGESGDDAQQILSELGLNDARLMRSFLQLSAAGDLITRTMQSSNTAWEQNTALANEANERYATMASIMDMLRNSFKKFQVEIGDTLRPALKQIVLGLQEVTEFGGGIVDVFKKRIGPAMEYFAIAVRMQLTGKDGALYAVKAGLVTLFGAETTMRIERFFTSLSSTVRRISNFIITYSDEIKAAIKGIGLALTASGIFALGQRITTSLIGPLNGLMLVVGALAIAWDKDWLGIRTSIMSVIDELSPEIIGFGEKLKNWLTIDLIPKIERGDWEGIGSDIGGFIVEGVKIAFRLGGGIMDSLQKALKDALVQALFPTEPDIFEGAPSDVLKAYQEQAERTAQPHSWWEIGWKIGSSLTKGLWAGLQGLWSAVPEGEAQAAVGAVGGVLAMLEGIRLARGTMKVLEVLGKGLGGVVTLLGSKGALIVGVIAAIGALAATWETVGGPAMQNMADWFMTKIPEAWTKFREIWTTDGQPTMDEVVSSLEKVPEAGAPEGPAAAPGAPGAQPGVTPTAAAPIEAPVELQPEADSNLMFSLLTGTYSPVIRPKLDPLSLLIRPEEYLEPLQPEQMSFWEQIAHYFTRPFGKIATKINEITGKIDPFAGIWAMTTAWWDQKAWPWITEKVGLTWEYFKNSWVSTWYILKGTFIIWYVDVRDKWNTFVDTLKTKWQELRDTISQGWVDFLVMWDAEVMPWLDQLYLELDELEKRLQRLGLIQVEARGPGGIKAFANGGWVRAMVGERGPEMVSLPVGSYVHPARETAAMGGVTFGPGSVVVNNPRNADDVSIGILQALREAGVA